MEGHSVLSLEKWNEQVEISLWGWRSKRVRGEPCAAWPDERRVAIVECWVLGVGGGKRLSKDGPEHKWSQSDLTWLPVSEKVCLERVRKRLREKSKKNYKEIIDTACLEVLNRGEWVLVLDGEGPRDRGVSTECGKAYLGRGKGVSAPSCPCKSYCQCIPCSVV